MKNIVTFREMSIQAEHKRAAEEAEIRRLIKFLSDNNYNRKEFVIIQDGTEYSLLKKISKISLTN